MSRSERQKMKEAMKQYHQVMEQAAKRRAQMSPEDLRALKEREEQWKQAHQPSIPDQIKALEASRPKPLTFKDRVVILILVGALIGSVVVSIYGKYIAPILFLGLTSLLLLSFYIWAISSDKEKNAEIDRKISELKARQCAQDSTPEKATRTNALPKQDLVEKMPQKGDAAGDNATPFLPTIEHKPLPAFAPIQRSGVSELAFFRKYESEKRDHPFRPEYIGLLNPYLKEPVQSEADYYLYLREHTYQILCDKMVTDSTEEICAQAKREILLADADRRTAWEYVDKRDKVLRRMRTLFFVLLGLILALASAMVYLAWFR
jgi:Flp pilus assembly protein TadB